MLYAEHKPSSILTFESALFRGRSSSGPQAIYPIKYQEKLGAYTIRGLEVPADLYSVDDEKVSSALGYTAHLVCMLAKYLQVPLRYQLIYNASRCVARL